MHSKKKVLIVRILVCYEQYVLVYRARFVLVTPPPHILSTYHFQRTSLQSKMSRYSCSTRFKYWNGFRHFGNVCKRRECFGRHGRGIQEHMTSAQMSLASYIVVVVIIVHYCALWVQDVKVATHNRFEVWHGILIYFPSSYSTFLQGY